jgi:hypothetical protein
MSTILLVPVHLDALVLDHDEMIVDSTADFSRLPYCTGSRDINSDVANVSEDIVSTPFANQNLLLEAGIHLHWSLPDALTRARRSSSQTQEFPRVPNRWLVTCCNAGGDVEKEWLIESDYLYPSSNAATQIESGVAVPYHQGRGQRFRYMGRNLKISDRDREVGEYYPRLTAIGYGEPTFAAFYPNCFSVFGFFEKYTGKIEGRQYYLTGWYSNPDHDVLRTEFLPRPGEPTDSASLIDKLREQFKWSLTLPAGQEFPTRMLCYARLVIGKASVPQPDGPITIAVGNTGTEALSSCVAHNLAQKSARNGAKLVFEDHFEALHLASKLEHRQLDLSAKFIEAQHEKGFTAVTGGILWTVRAESKEDSTAEAGKVQETTLPGELGHLLNVVNERQAEYDRAWQQIESLRIQLYSDWYKYMLCAYPPDDARDLYPDIDEVRSYVEGNVDSLNKKIEHAGTLMLNEDDGRVRAEAAAGSTAVLAEALARSINQLQWFLDTHNAPNKGIDFRLKQSSSPRYWRPTEPAILLEGSLVKPSKRYGQDGLLETRLLTGATPDPSEDNFRKRIRETIAQLGLAAGSQFPFRTWDGQPWNPFLLEWQVEVFPIEHDSNIDPATGRYHEDFIIANYELPENAIELSLKTGKGAIMQAANIYSGRSILTPYASVQLAHRLNSYLSREVLPLYYEAKGVPVLKQETSDLEEHLKDVQEWYEDDEQSPLLHAGDPEEDTTRTALRGKLALRNMNSVSQSLGGFNDALLMHQQTPQLHVADPLGFNDYQPFAGIVHDAVNSSIYSAPKPLNDFNPIRTGAMKIHRLRLVDTFGQIRDLDVTDILPSKALSGSEAPLINLPPRLVQPARVNFRWLAADTNEQEMNDHPATSPICGWVLANHLDASLMIYDHRGKALGSLAKKNKLPEWLPAPGGRGISTIDKIENPHLQKMVATIRDWGTNFLDDFIVALDSAVKNIEPENFAQHQDLALLMGRPLALVRASVNLELKGLPASHQGWNEFRKDMQREGRDDNGFSRVRFPIRIGEYMQFNDGTVGYWREKRDGSYEDDVFFAPQSDAEVKFKGEHLKTHKTNPEAMVFLQTVESEPQILSLLIDPRGLVHATTGILPVKAIHIPPDQYAAALQDIEITFLSTPILTDAGKIHLPLPDEPGFQWSWLHQEARKSWSEVSSRGLVLKDTLAVFGDEADKVWNELIAQDWIKLIDEKDPNRASVTAKDQRKNQLLPDRWKDKTKTIEDVLDRAHIGPVDQTAKFSGPQEIREGWLKLSAAKDVEPSKNSKR